MGACIPCGAGVAEGGLRDRMLGMSLFQLGDFTLHSGAKSRWKIDCDALTDDDWKTLAAMLVERVGRFTCAVGVPRGGLKLAREIGLAFTPSVSNERFLIVDDVLTTGRSMEEMCQKLTGLHSRDAHAQGKVIGGVAFARGKCPEWITPIFTMPELS